MHDDALSKGLEDGHRQRPFALVRSYEGQPEQDNSALFTSMITDEKNVPLSDL